MTDHAAEARDRCLELMAFEIGEFDAIIREAIDAEAADLKAKLKTDANAHDTIEAEQAKRAIALRGEIMQLKAKLAEREQRVKRAEEILDAITRAGRWTASYEELPAAVTALKAKLAEARKAALDLSDDELSALCEACNVARQAVWKARDPKRSRIMAPRPPWDRAGSSAHKKLVDEEMRRGEQPEQETKT